ncbi:MAG: hemolysin family protein [Thermoguttaceae bacterium]
MSTATLLWITAASLCITCLAAMSARALAEFSPAELEEICRKWNKLDRLGHILHWRDQVGLAMQSLRTLAVAMAAATGGIALWQHSQPVGFAVGAWASGLLLVLAANLWLPWTFARLWANPFLFFAWPVLWGASFLLVPLALLAHVVDVALHRLAGRNLAAPDEESFEEDIRSIVSEGHREGLLEEEAREMIEGVIELGDADVSQIMTPRTDMLSIPASLSWEEMLAQVIDAGHTRIPVYGRNRDDILGILHTKDLLPELSHGPGQRADHWTKLLRQPVFVPETKPIDALLQELQRSRNHMVVVLDEYGGVSGLVTMEDVLEEIVGEIVDEYDPAHVEGVRELGPGACEAMGRVHIDEINERLGLGLPEDADYDTIGGFVFNELGHIPTTGEDLIWHNVRITVLDATRRRIERVRIEVLDAAGLPTPQG